MIGHDDSRRYKPRRPRRRQRTTRERRDQRAAARLIRRAVHRRCRGCGPRGMASRSAGGAVEQVTLRWNTTARSPAARRRRPGRSTGASTATPAEKSRIEGEQRVLGLRPGAAREPAGRRRGRGRRCRPGRRCPPPHSAARCRARRRCPARSRAGGAAIGVRSGGERSMTGVVGADQGGIGAKSGWPGGIRATKPALAEERGSLLFGHSRRRRLWDATELSSARRPWGRPDRRRSSARRASGRRPA